MLTIAIPVVLALFISIAIMTSDGGFDGIEIAMFSFIWMMVAGFVAFLLCIPLYMWGPTTTDHYDDPLVALRDNPTTTGQFYFLGSGFINGSAGYTYYVNEDDGLVLRTIDGDYAVVHEEPGVTPHRVLHIKHPTLNGWWMPFQDDERTVDFYVPPGTVDRSFGLDAQ